MRIFFISLFLFYLYLEACMMSIVSTHIGVASMLLVLLATSLLGLKLIKQQGFSTLKILQNKMLQHENPTREIIQSFILLFCGVLLIIPGFISDIFALLLYLVPYKKSLVLKFSRFTTRQEASIPEASAPSSTKRSPCIIEGEYYRKDENM